jgi:hypothetical protein
MSRWRTNGKKEEGPRECVALRGAAMHASPHKQRATRRAKEHRKKTGAREREEEKTEQNKQTEAAKENRSRSRAGRRSKEAAVAVTARGGSGLVRKRSESEKAGSNRA